MTEYDVACFLARELFQLSRARRAEPPEPLGGRGISFGDQRHLSTNRRRTLGDNDDTESRAEFFALAQTFRHDIQIERDRGDQDYMGATRHSWVQRDRSG